MPVRPRPTAAPRVRKLGLAGYVHLSFVPTTPLLADKRARGWPHALLEFHGDLLWQPGVALLRYNTKAWRHRDDFAPVTGEAEKRALLAEREAGLYPSMEVLVPDRLTLTMATALHVPGEEEASLLARLAECGVGPAALPEVRVSAAVFPPAGPSGLTAVAAYYAECAAAGRVLPPPDLPFD